MSEDLTAIVIAKWLNAIANVIEKSKAISDKQRAVKLLRTYAESFRDGWYDSNLEQEGMTYEQQLRFCSKHGFVCLEYYRRHGVPDEVMASEL